jgi:hypothetical protein
MQEPISTESQPVVKRGPGRPRKIPGSVNVVLDGMVSGPRGRPRKIDGNGNILVKKERPPFEMRVVKTLKSDKVDVKNRIDLIVSRWKLASHAVLEKRRIFTLPNGEERMLKSVGFNVSDIQFVSEHKDEIIKVMESAKEWSSVVGIPQEK